MLNDFINIAKFDNEAKRYRIQTETDNINFKFIQFLQKKTVKKKANFI